MLADAGIAVLALLPLAARGMNVPLLKNVEQFILSDNVETIEFEPAVEIKASNDVRAEPTEAWACDIRSWVRAPDLIPSKAIYGETRLAVNGSACGDIVGWDVGLRLKERAIIKTKSKIVHNFPTRPARPKYNGSNEQDYNNIFNLNQGWSFPALDYDTQLQAYAVAMRNESLWDIHSAERVVFDLAQPLALDLISKDKVDVSRSFYVHVPNTNFPPVSAQTWSSGFGEGADGQFINSETQMEYYHSIHLANGTVLDIPAGRAAFLPNPEVTAPSSAVSAREVVPQAWPIELKLSSPRVPIENVTDGTEDENWWGSRDPYTPKCDAGNLAQFTLEVKTDTKVAVQGQNMTLNFTLTRTGNGTEYPTFLDVHSRTERNLTWAYHFVNSEDDYDDLLQGYHGGYRRGGQAGRRRDAPQPSIEAMLRTKSMRELELQREMMSAQSGGYISISGDRWPLSPGEVRYDIEDEGELGKEAYTWQVEIPISERAFPSFVTTFEDYQPVLQFSLHTTFLCESARPYYEDETDDLEEDESSVLDTEWAEYKLPLDDDKHSTSKKKDKKKFRDGRTLVHSGSIPIDIKVALTPADQQYSDITELPVHYLDPQALAPVLSLDSTPVDMNTAVGGILEDADTDRLKKSRYTMDNRAQFMRGRRFKNSGGLWSHAGSIWQSTEMKAQKKA